MLQNRFHCALAILVAAVLVLPGTAVAGCAKGCTSCATHAAVAVADAAPAESSAAAAMPPAPLRPWLVTRHPVGDSASHVLDMGFSPAYWGMAHAWWWIEGQVYHDPAPRVRLRMAHPATQPTP